MSTRQVGTEQGQGKHPRRGLLAALGAALALFAVGGAAVFQMATAAPPKEMQQSEADLPPASRTTAIHDIKTAAQMGYPALAGGYGYQSMEAPNGNGSVAYMVRKTTAGEVVQFYRKKLDASGWKFKAQQKTSMHPAGNGQGPLFAGYITRWDAGDGSKELSLWSLDDPQRKGSAQVLLTWELTANKQPPIGSPRKTD